MRLVEAISLKLNRKIQVLVSELVRIDRTEGVSDAAKHKEIEGVLLMGIDLIRASVMAEAEHLLAMNRNSHHDFNQEVQTIIKLPAPSIVREMNRQVVGERHP